MNKETLEEAFEKWDEINPSYTKYDVLRFGAKWQQEQDKNNEKELYSEIEYLIINWSNDGTKTAGALTRQIIEQFKKK